MEKRDQEFYFSDVTSFYFTSSELNKIRQHTIGIAGVGGIGSNCAVLLVRSGFSKFIIADFDKVSLSNLNRQIYLPQHINRLKVECLVEICKSINPEIEVSAFPIKIDSSNINIFDKCDIVIEAFDNASSKAMFFSQLINSGKLLIGVSGIAGIGKSEEIKIRKIRENCYIVGDENSEVSEKLKPYAPRVTIAAAKIADLILSYVLFKTI
ncbi:MAG: sulfur carrier protein ThiS adenylyltransferase ThiF [Chitinispirillaceae bacterium]|nr:sulfur carrier protein ThiS adenylyltransferase ThiF [Chitinispirillaceae bacterium]